MNFTHLTRIGLAVLMCNIFCIGIVESQSLSPEDFSNPTQVKEELFGFNGGFMMEACGATTDSLYEGVEAPLVDFHLNEACLELTNKINPNVMRFPGGTASNFYHFYGNGYGFQADEVIGTKFNDFLSTELWLPENHIVNFADLALQSGTKVIYVLNLITHFKDGGIALTNPEAPSYIEKLEENFAAIDYLISRGVEVVGVELGNEIYAYNEVNFSSTTRSQYINLSRIYTENVKLRYPDMPVGIPIKRVSGYIDIYFNVWNKTMKFANFVDAYIVHTYEKRVKGSCSVDNLSKVDYFDCAKDRIDNYLENNLENDLEILWSFYGRSKQLWLTEWNILNPQVVSNTFLHAYFVQKHWNMLMELEKKHPGNIGFTNCHNFISGGYLYPAVGLRQPNEDPSLEVVDKFAYRSTFYPHVMMSEVLKPENQFVGKVDFAGCEAWLYKTTNKEYYLVLINGEKTDHNLTLTQVDQLILDNTEPIAFKSISRLNADNLYDAAGINFHNLNETNVTNDLTFVEHLSIENLSSIDVPKISLSVIKIGAADAIPQFELSNFNSTIEDCNISLSWSIANDKNTYFYVVNNNGHPIDTIQSLGDAPSQQYNYPIVSDSNQTYNFRVKAYENTELLASSGEETIIADCIPIPDPMITFTQVILDNNCNIVYTWRVQDHTPNTSFIVAVSVGSSTLLDTVYSSLASLYSYTYIPDENGNFEFQLVILENNQYVSVTNPEVVNVDCIEMPPVVTSFDVTKNEDCSYTFDWIVINEQIGSSYTVSNSINNEAFNIINTQFSAGNSSVTAYSYTFHPEVNANYVFRLKQFVNSELLSTNDLNPIDIDCAPLPDPVLETFEIVDNNDCTFDIEWTVSGELTSSSYILYSRRNDGSLEQIHALSANEELALANYSYTFIPEINGQYTFEIEQFRDGASIESRSATIDISCLVIPDPIISEYVVSDNGDCTFDISWLVTGELSTSAYTLFVNLDNDSLESIYDVVATQSADSVVYQFLYTPQINGTYEIVIQQFREGILVSSPASDLINVTCILPPTPVVENFDVINNGDCTYELAWSVSNELLSSSYQLYVSVDGNNFESITTINSTEEIINKDYSYTYSPTVNGNYTFKLEQLSDGTLENTFEKINNVVSCIPPPEPFIEVFDLVENGNCTFDVNWTISNEISSTSYALLYAVNNGTFETLHSTISNGNLATTNYSYTFTPIENSSYDFQLVQFDNGEFLSSSNIETIAVNCVASPLPSLNSFTVETNENCIVDVNWNVANQSEETIFVLNERLEGGTFLPKESFSGNNGNSTQTFDYSLEVNEEGNYDYQLEVFQNGEYATNSFIESTFVGCQQDLSLSIKANPVITFGAFTTTITSNQPIDGTLKIVNSFTGQTVFQRDYSLDQGINKIYKNFNNFPSAFSSLYIISFNYSGGSKNTSIIYF